jgi:hypothetical protein
MRGSLLVLIIPTQRTSSTDTCEQRERGGRERERERERKRA